MGGRKSDLIVATQPNVQRRAVEGCFRRKWAETGTHARRTFRETGRTIGGRTRDYLRRIQRTVTLVTGKEERTMTNELRIAELPANRLGGLLGVTFAPGKKAQGRPDRRS